jgi:hypothetical protein
MPKFTVRIQLRKSKPADYDDLHVVMEEAGYKRTLFYGKNKPKKQLPDAEYRRTGSQLTRDGVGRRAFELAESVKPNPMVLVTEGEVWEEGLDDVED